MIALHPDDQVERVQAWLAECPALKLCPSCLAGETHPLNCPLCTDAINSLPDIDDDDGPVCEFCDKRDVAWNEDLWCYACDECAADSISAARHEADERAMLRTI